VIARVAAAALAAALATASGVAGAAPHAAGDAEPAETGAANGPAVAAGRHGAVATDQVLATDVGLAVLRAGGNAVDAAVAIGYALAVVYPSAGNIGGGGFMLVREQSGSAHFIDFRETAPVRATATMYLDRRGKVVPELSTVGGLSVAVPGTVAGLELARARYGTRSRAALLAPAIALAAKGWVLRPADADVFAANAALLRRFPSTMAAFAPSGRLPRAGDRLRQPALAATLRTIAREGPAGFARGSVAAKIAAADERAGGILSRADLAAYRAVERPPVRCALGADRIASSPQPSSGGIAICETLGILADLPPAPIGSVRAAHDLLEAERRAFADRSVALGDPTVVPDPSARLLAAARLRSLAAGIAPDRATPSRELRGAAEREGRNTTNYAVVDARGNAVDVTYTLNSTFGSGLVAAGTGVLLNNEMDDFASKPGVPNQFGLVGSRANAIRPGKRPLSSMSPTIVSDAAGRVVLVAGAAGGPRIVTTTLLIVRDVVVRHAPVGRAVDAPRLHEQWLPDVVYAEPGALAPPVLRALRAEGYAIELGPAESEANAVAVGPGGTRTAAHDPRRPTGSAGAY